MLEFIGIIVGTIFLVWLTLNSIAWVLMTDESLINTIKWNFKKGLWTYFLQFAVAMALWYFWLSYIIPKIHVSFG